MPPGFGSEPFVVRVFGPHGMEMREFSADASRITVGRDSACDISLSDSAVSREHLTLHVSRDNLLIEDTSANGSLVDGVLVQRKVVARSRSSLVRLGRYELRFGDRDATYEHLATETPETSPSPALSMQQTHAPSTHAPLHPPAAEQSALMEANLGTSRVSAQVRRKLHVSLVEHLDLVKLERSRLNPRLLRAKVELGLKEIVANHSHIIPQGTDIERLIQELSDEAVGLGPLEDLLADDSVSEIMVVDPTTIYAERGGKMELTGTRFTDNESVRSTLERIVMPLGRRIDESAPMLDARLPDGSRVNAVIPPLATRGPCITIRKFSKKPLGMQNLLGFGSIDERMSRFLERSVQARKNIVVAGGTGSGKTTLLNVLSAACSDTDRIVTIEDSAELQLQQSHVVTLEARPPNMEGKGEVSIRDLVKNAMRMRPDRIIVGECRGGEALDMLLAMNTGHDGSMTTTHANTPQEALRRIESLALMSGVELPARAIREQIAYAVDLLVHQTRFSDGSRRVTSITEVVGLEDGQIETREIFGYRRTMTSEVGDVSGEFYATGYLPSYLVEFLALGIIKEGDTYL
ncbi:MAG: Flp pilus assembly complex ATPase component [Myxococcales bacterium]|nr:Flp pilus assembly complex ATPase component [Myxococcales bacterium]